MIIYPLKKNAFFLLAFLFASAVFCMAEEPTKNELPAKEFSSAKTGDDKLVVELTFLPVSSFDDDSNQRMSEKLASVFLQEDISKHFKSQKVVELSKVEKAEKKRTEQEWSLTYTVPASAIVDGKEKPVPNTINVIKKYYPSETVKSALRDSKAFLIRDLKIAEAFFLEQITDDKTLPEQKIATAFDAFEKKVNADDSLFLSDKDGLHSQARSVRDFLLRKKAEQDTASKQTSQPDESNGTKNAAWTAKTPPVAIAQANILPEYEPMLMSNSILLEGGGWSTFQKEDGSLYLVVVGVAAVKDDSAKDRIQRRKTAETSAYSELAKIPNMDIKTFSQHFVSETTKNDQVELIDSFQSKVVSCAENHVKSMPTVGTWYSSDGKLFFLAIGSKL